MRFVPLAILVLPLALVACGHKGSAKLEGHWRGTRADAPFAQRDAANAFALGTEITAKGNVITVSTPGGHHETATYSVDDDTRGTLVIHTDKDPTRETFSIAEDGKTMRWRIDDGNGIIFAKQAN